MMRRLRDSGIKWIGKIPENWRIESIGRHFENRNEKVSDYDYAPLSVTKSGVVPQLDEVAKSNAHEDRKLVRRGDFVINSRSDRKQSCGLSVYDGSVSLINLVLVPHGEIDSSYSSYLFNNYGFAEEFYRWGTGIVADLWSTKWDLMRRINVPVPPHAEQKKIADFLDGKCAEIDELVQTEEKMIEELKAYKQSVITEAVTKGLDSAAPMKDSGIEWIGEIPESWEVLSLKRLFSARRGGAWGEDATNNEGDIICLRVADFNYDELCIKEGDKTIRNYSPQTIKNLRLKSNDLLIEKSGGGEKTPVGRCILPTGYEGCLYANFIERLTIKTNCYNKYIVYLMSVAYLNRINTPHIKQTTGIQNLDMEGYLSEDVAIPSLDEQKQIADYLDEKCAKIDEIIALRTEQINQLKEYKKSLIYEYVTGKKEVV